MAFAVVKAVGGKHLWPPIWAELVLGRKQPVAQLHENKIKEKG